MARRSPPDAPEVRLRERGVVFFFPAWTVPAAGLAFLTFNSVMAVYHSKGDGTILAFVATSYLDIVLLCCCLWLYERAGPPWRNWLKASVWTLTTLLTFSFSYIAMGMAQLTLPVALHVWIIAAATGIGAFSVFFDLGRSGPPPAATTPHERGTVFPAWMVPAAGLAFLTFNSVMAVYHSKGDGAILAFVATSYLDIVLLCCCLWLYERAGPPWRNWLKASVWTLTTLLTFSFGYIAMGTAQLTLPVALHVWIIAAATGIGAFFVFFDLGRRINQQMPGDPTLPV